MEEQNWTRGPTIGRGSTATVSLAITNSGEFFAVKSAEFSSSAFLQREETILSSLSSPYVVKYIGSNTTTENDTLTYYNLLMEYAPAGSLHDLIKNSGGKLPEPVIRTYTRQILRGLMYLHERGVVHCDLKSRNVMIGGETAKIADLGCAKMAGNGSLEFSGTPAFMSPEVARGEEQSFPADVWALGCVVIEMATGLSPWPELNDVVAAVYKIGFAGESPEIPECLSEKGRDFLRKCLRKDPKQRWAVEELLQHPFLDEEDQTQTQFLSCLNTTSPSNVLDQRFWDSCETSRSVYHEDTFARGSSPADRIKRLVGDENSGEPEWITAEDGWIGVRGGDGEIEKRNEEDVNCVEATSLEVDEMGGYENWILDQEDGLFLEYSATENNIFYFYSDDLFGEDNLILYYDDHLEYGFVQVLDLLIITIISLVASRYNSTSSSFFITIDTVLSFDKYTKNYSGNFLDVTGKMLCIQGLTIVIVCDYVTLFFSTAHLN